MDTRIDIDGGSCRVSVDFGGYIIDDNLSPDGLTYVRAVLAARNRAQVLATQTLLDDYNDNWTDEEHPVLSPEAFAGALSVSLVQILDVPGVADLYFDDGDMFGGHSIVVSFDGTTPTVAQLMG